MTPKNCLTYNFSLQYLYILQPTVLAEKRNLSAGRCHTQEEGEYEFFYAHQEQNLIHAARNLNTRLFNNRANDDSLLYDSTAR